MTKKKDSPSLVKKRGQIEEKLAGISAGFSAKLSSAERVALARHSARPKAVDFIKNLATHFVELAGDRLIRDDPAVIGGFATIAGKRVVLVAQEKGNDTESRLKRNFGMVHPEGFRKTLRLALLAEKFNLPLILLVDTPGAFPGIAAEERGQGWAIAENLKELFRIKTPILVLILGEASSGGALGMGIGDAVGMLENAYFSVISPEGCASILWRDAKRSPEAAAALKLHAEDMLAFEVVEEIIQEGRGAHLDPELTYANCLSFISKRLNDLRKVPIANLLELRYRKYRKIGSHISSEPKVASAP